MTVNIPTTLLLRAKRLAARERTTLKVVVERGLQLVLSESKPASAFRLRRASVKGKGLQPEWRDTSWDQIRDFTYDERPPAASAPRPPLKSSAGFRARQPRPRQPSRESLRNLRDESR